MSYSAEISRRNPSCIMFLLDQSGSMSEEFGRSEGIIKAQGAADAINRLIHIIGHRCTKEEGIRDYFHIAIVGYGSKEGYTGPLVGEKFVKISWLYEHPLRVEERMRKEPNGAGGYIEVKVKFPIWFDPISNADTPMCKALELGYEWLKEWISEHPDAYPPIVFNITDGEATDGDPEPIGKRITELSTSDGYVLMFNCHISRTTASPILFPAEENELPTDEFAKKLFRMSSKLPESMLNLAEKEFKQAKEDSKGFAFNADLVDLIRFLDLGTRPSLRQLE